MRLWTNIAISCICGTAAAVWLPLSHLAIAFTPLTTVLSIMAAAVLVRLNRGMPTIDWKGVPAAQRNNLTQAIVNLAAEYLGALGVIAVLVAVLLGTIIVGGDWWNLEDPKWVLWLQRAASAIIMFLISLLMLRMGYIAWRDFDVVRMQKAAIDKAADAEELSQQITEAEKKMSAMQSSNLRSQPAAKPQAWDA